MKIFDAHTTFPPISRRDDKTMATAATPRPNNMAPLTSAGRVQWNGAKHQEAVDLLRGKGRRMLLAAASAFWTIAMAHGSVAEIDTLIQSDTALRVPPIDHPAEPGAIITRLNTKHGAGLDDTTLSTFVVDYPPGGSAILHRRPSSGYVLVYVLSGTIRASAWHAGVGTYRAGEMWVEPALAYDIAAKNPSPDESARTFVVLVTGSQERDSANGTILAK